MSAPVIAIIAVLAAVIAVLAVLLLQPEKAAPPEPPREGDTHEEPSPEGVVTVRHAGQSMTIVIRDGTRLRDGMEGGGGITLPQLPTEAAARIFPALYSEYMSPDTSASRKYEIIDLLYDLGFTLPYTKGLYEQYRRERDEAGKAGGDAAVINESTPPAVPRDLRKARTIRTAVIDESLRHVDQPDMEDDGDDAPARETAEHPEKTVNPSISHESVKR